jgi:hypothetical protein
MQSEKSLPYYGTWPASCANGVQNSGLNTPVPHAVLTVNGKSYTFGVRPATFINSYTYSLNATAPQTQLSTHFYQTRFNWADPSLWGSEAAQVNIYLYSIYKCRSWESAFSYALMPGKGDTFDGQVAVSYGNLNSGAIYTNFSGYIKVSTVTVSGPITPPKTPHIFFFDNSKGKSVDATETPQSVVAGQQIQLFVSPEPTTEQPPTVAVAVSTASTSVPVGSGLPPPWKIESSKNNPFKIVGNYTTPLLPSAGPAAAPAFITPVDSVHSTGSVAPAFYWITPGTFTVAYDYTEPNGTDFTVAATFNVDGPTAKEVTTSPVAGTSNFENLNSDGYSFPIDFSQTTVPAKSHRGYLFWTQLVDSQNVTTVSSQIDVITGQVGLDNSFPYAGGYDPSSTAIFSTCYNTGTRDEPYKQLKAGYYIYNQQASFRMYLMWKWQGSAPNIIPVALGFVPWSFDISVVRNGETLIFNPNAPHKIEIGSFIPILNNTEPKKDLPQWTDVALNVGDTPTIEPCNPPP